MERYDDMISTVRVLVKTVYEASLSSEDKKESLNALERNLLASSYKNSVRRLLVANQLFAFMRY